MSKMQTVQKDMMQALKAGDTARKDALSILLGSLKAKWKDKRAELTEEEENAIVLKEIKQAKETMDSAPADREDVRKECRQRIAVYEQYAPKQMDEAEIRAAIEEVLAGLGLQAPTPKDKGPIMRELMPKVKGRADGGQVNRLVAEYLK